MVECITIDGNCPREGYYVDGIRIVQILEEWQSDILTHHLVVLEFSSDYVGHYFHGGDLAILQTQTSANGLVLQIAGRHESMVRFLSDIRTKISVERYLEKARKVWSRKVLLCSNTESCDSP